MDMKDFLDHMRTIHGGQEDELFDIIDRLEDTDDGLKLLAACSCYALDVYNVEENLEAWYEEYFEWTAEKRETLFRYMLLEAVDLPKHEFMTDYFSEALEYLGVEFDEEALMEAIENLDKDNLPTLADISA